MQIGGDRWERKGEEKGKIGCKASNKSEGSDQLCTILPTTLSYPILPPYLIIHDLEHWPHSFFCLLLSILLIREIDTCRPITHTGTVYWGKDAKLTLEKFYSTLNYFSTSLKFWEVILHWDFYSHFSEVLVICLEAELAFDTIGANDICHPHLELPTFLQ